MANWRHLAASGDRAALMALHESTDGENWKDDTNWGTDEDLSEWHGVWTDDEIPAELENTAMEVLVITGTSITGGIPPELGKLANLIALDLRDNPDMSGGIPPELGGLASLEILYLRSGVIGSILVSSEGWDSSAIRSGCGNRQPRGGLQPGRTEWLT